MKKEWFIGEMYPISYQIAFYLSFFIHIYLMFLMVDYLPQDASWWSLALCLFGGLLIADLFSGSVHFFFDTFGTVDTPFFGDLVIRDFRMHHHEPQKMLKHNFIEVSGSISFATVPFFIFWIYFFAATNPWASAVLFGTGVTSTFTNEIHKLAHNPNPPRWVRFLQKCWLILPPEHHRIHHTAPYKNAYCITFGWLNPILDKIRFFQTIERLGSRWADKEQKV